MEQEGRFGAYVKKVGKKYYPEGRPVIHSEDLWREKTWEIRRYPDGRLFFEKMNGGHGGGVIVYELSEKEFEEVKKGRLSYDDLIELTDYNPDRHPVKVT